MFRYHCGEARIPLGKFVIPNPFGPFEEPRFTAYLMRSWKDGKPAGVKTPDYVRDNVPVDLLAPSMHSLPSGSRHQRARSRSIPAATLRSRATSRSVSRAKPGNGWAGMQIGTGATGGFQRTAAPGQHRSGHAAGSGLE